MTVRVLFFGALRDLAGRAEDTLTLDSGTLRGVFERYPQLAPYAKSIVLARNQEFAAPETELADGDEIAFLPPVSGGAEPGNFYELTRAAIDAEAMKRRLLRGEDGAICVFEGVTRNNNKGRAVLRLDYECYEPMALKLMREIGEDIALRHAIGGIGMIHRLGRVEIGETSVAIAVVAPHRKPSFEAALEGINRLKKLVPIWKKEHFADGEVWVDGDWDESLVRVSS